MLLNFFYGLKSSGIPVSLREYLDLLNALDTDLAGKTTEGFYYLSRAALIKDERFLDKFDRVFSQIFRDVAGTEETPPVDIPEEWLRKLTERLLTDEEKDQIEALGGWDKIMEELRKRLAEQKGRHQGGSKWIGTAGTSPYGAYGYNPAGVRIGQAEGRNARAIKVWDRREYRDLDGSVELGTRNLKLALRRLRRFARDGAPQEFDLPGTIQGTAQKGYLDIAFRPERRNTLKVLLFFDVGGSMDWHVQTCAELFSAARAQFKHMEHFYFHNCLYESAWRDNTRRWSDRIPTWEILRTYPRDYKVIFVCDAAISPYEILVPGGSVEHFNEEPGQAWIERVTSTYRSAVWLNPLAEKFWGDMPSVGVIQQLFAGRMYPLTLQGIDRAVQELMR